MSTEHRLTIGNWYRNLNGVSFEIVACDYDDDTVELQHYDGTLEELDMDTWNQLPVEPIEPPEDWSGSLDIQREDYGVDLEQIAGETHSNPLDSLDLDH